MPRARLIAFVEVLQEWAELPADLEFAAWGAALAYEAAFGGWRGHAVRVLEVQGTRITDGLWRDRSAELVARARELETMPEPRELDLASGTARGPRTSRPDGATS
jgi:hypothetical protein